MLQLVPCIHFAFVRVCEIGTGFSYYTMILVGLTMHFVTLKPKVHRSSWKWWYFTDVGVVVCCPSVVNIMTFGLLNTQCSCTVFWQEIFNFWRKMCKVWNVWNIEYHEKEWDSTLSCYLGCFPEIFYLCRKRIAKWILRWKRPLKSVDRLATFSMPHTLQRGTVSMILISRYNWKMYEIMPGHWTTSENWTLDRLIILKGTFRWTFVVTEAPKQEVVKIFIHVSQNLSGFKTSLPASETLGNIHFSLNQIRKIIEAATISSGFLCILLEKLKFKEFMLYFKKTSMFKILKRVHWSNIVHLSQVFHLCPMQSSFPLVFVLWNNSCYIKWHEDRWFGKMSLIFCRQLVVITVL